MKMLKPLSDKEVEILLAIAKDKEKRAGQEMVEERKKYDLTVVALLRRLAKELKSM